MTRPYLVALTGGIASGKSTVAEQFAALGVTVIDLDQVARDVVMPGSALLEQLLRRFGAQLRREDGSLDRRALRDVVFADPAARAELEALLHPAILARTAALSDTAGGPYQIIVVPLLVETDAASRYDRVLLVDCDEAQQLQRLQQRDGIDRARAEAMLAAQATRRQRQAIADDVIRNDSGLAELATEVGRLHQRYLGLAGASSRIAG